MTYLFKDVAGTQPASDGDNVALVKRRAGTSNAIQPDADKQAIYYDQDTPRVVLDKIDDNYELDFTNTGGFVGTLYQGSVEGLVKAKVNIPAGKWQLTKNPANFPSDNIIGLIIVEDEPTPAQERAIVHWFSVKGCKLDFAEVTSFDYWFAERDDIEILYLQHWNVKPLSLKGFASESALTTLDLRQIDLSQLQNADNLIRNIPSFNDLQISSTTFRNSPCLSYQWSFDTDAFSTANIDEVLTEIEAAKTFGGVFLYNGFGVPSSKGEQAIDKLVARGWNVTVTGGYYPAYDLRYDGTYQYDGTKQYTGFE